MFLICTNQHAKTNAIVTNYGLPAHCIAEKGKLGKKRVAKTGLISEKKKKKYESQVSPQRYAYMHTSQDQYIVLRNQIFI